MTTGASPAGPHHGGWWAVDVAGYLLTRLHSLSGAPKPSDLDEEEVIEWIRLTELGWAPGCADLRRTVPWEKLREFGDEAALVEYVLVKASEEVKAAEAANEGNSLCPFAARRIMPLGTMAAYGCSIGSGSTLSGASADGHVHQGAAVPIEVTLHWIADGITTIGGNPGEISLPPIKDTDQVEFHPLPLLMLLRALDQDCVWLDEGQTLKLFVESAKGDPDSWNALNARLDLSGRFREHVPTFSELVEGKVRARTGWAPWRYVTLLRTEAILQGAVSQREAGLDVFVEQFDRLRSMRRVQLPQEAKAEYLRESIANHVARSDHKLKGLELRLGEPVAGGGVKQRAVENDYLAALKGYRRHIKQETNPVHVTFPWGLVKSRPGTRSKAAHWRFNPKGIYELVEVLLDVLEKHPSLADFVDGIDVCGLEEGEPNWLFAPAFKRFSARTAHLRPAPACRFHAGEWQWTPLHGLRRIAEFLRFDLDPETPRRIGHGLALHSNHWGRISEEPADELLDDLLWALERIERIEDAPAALHRAVRRIILDLRGVVYGDADSQAASVEQLMGGYGARFDVASLEKVSFLYQEENGRLTFGDRQPNFSRSEPQLRLLAAYLGAERPESPSVAEVIGTNVMPGVSVHSLRAMLADLYDILAPEIIDDIRWEGVVVEACPTSNVIAGGVRGYAQHPMEQLVARGILMTLNSDDPSIFHAWMPDELSHAEHRMGVPRRQVRSSRELGLRLVAPGLRGASNVAGKLDTVIASLEGRAA